MATQKQEKYEVRLFRIQGDEEFEVERREVPMDKVQEQIAELPEREAMSLINANVAAPINLALAANVLSDNSAAIANAEQWTPIDQST